MQDLQFSTQRHATFCKGYLDAIGRAYTDDQTLYGFTLRSLEASDSISEILGSFVSREIPTTNISIELEALLQEVLGTSNDRLTWYAIEYLEWFGRNIPETTWYKLEHELPDDATKKQYAYLLRIPDEQDLFLIASIRKKGAENDTTDNVQPTPNE